MLRFNAEPVEMWQLMQEAYGCQAPGTGVYEQDILDYPWVYCRYV